MCIAFRRILLVVKDIQRFHGFLIIIKIYFQLSNFLCKMFKNINFLAQETKPPFIKLKTVLFKRLTAMNLILTVHVFEIIDKNYRQVPFQEVQL